MIHSYMEIHDFKFTFKYFNLKLCVVNGDFTVVSIQPNITIKILTANI